MSKTPQSAPPLPSGSPRAGFVAGRADVVWLSGADRLGFLERMSTARLADLAPGAGRATAVLTDAGRVVDLVACHAGPDGAVLVTSGPGAAATVADHLRRYVLYGDDVRVTDASAQVVALRLVGPAAGAVAAADAGRPAAGADAAGPGAAGLDPSALAPGGWVESGEGEGAAWILRHPDPGGLGGFDVVVPAGDPAARMAARLERAGAARLSDGDLARHRIGARLPAFGAEIGGAAGAVNPLEVGLRDVVDFAKGCYVGQEVVARLDSYDKVQRNLVRLHTAAEIRPGDPVWPAEDVAGNRPRPGHVTTAAPAEATAGAGWIALAVVPLALAGRSDVVVETAAGRVRAGVT